MAEQTNGVKASFDVESIEGQMKVFNAQNGASKSLKTLGNEQVIECNGAMIYADTVDTYDANGQDGEISVLFGTDGNSYAGISATVAKATSKLIDFVNKTGLETFNVMVIKQESNSGREFLNIQLV